MRHNSAQTFERWYDKYPELSDQFKVLSKISQKRLDAVLIGVKDIIKIYEPGLIDHSVLNFEDKRRWYDKDPYTWLIINALAHAKKRIIDRVIAYLKYSLKKFRAKKPSKKKQATKKKSSPKKPLKKSSKKKSIKKSRKKKAK